MYNPVLLLWNQSSGHNNSVYLMRQHIAEMVDIHVDFESAKCAYCVYM